MMEEHLALPFSVKILGVEADVEKVDMTRDGRIVAVCRRGKTRQKIRILDLPLPKPAPAGAEWIVGLQPLAQRVLSERIPVLRLQSNRPSR